jgi:hypothetical protein
VIERDGETVSIPEDARGSRRGFPGQNDPSKRPGRANLWNATEAVGFDPAPVWGTYPNRFVAWALDAIQCRPWEVLHVCSGALGRDVGGVRVDIRSDAAPDVIADGTALPFRSQAFAGVLLDPPYSIETAAELYGTGYPLPSRLLTEAARVTRAGGRIGFLHLLVPRPVPSLSLERVFGVTQGCGYRIRAFTVLQRRHPDLFGEV